MKQILPLSGKHVLITRGGERGSQVADKIQHYGGSAVIVPLIDFALHVDKQEKHFIKQLDEYDWIIFTSKNGVRFFFERLQALSIPFPLSCSGQRFAVVGEKTKEALEAYFVSSTFMPAFYTARDFAKEFFQMHKAKKSLVVKGNLASATIAKSFQDRHIPVDEWIVYETFFPEPSKLQLASMLREKKLDIITFTSPSTFYHFLQVVEEYGLMKEALKPKIVCIGPVTKAAIESHGFVVTASPNTYTMEAMVDELAANFTDNE